MPQSTVVLSSLLLLGFAGLINADPCSALNFSCLQVGEQVLNYYDSGFGSLGSGPGPSLGITFTPDVVVVPEGVSLEDVLQGAQVGSGAVMNVAGGFSGLFSFYYMDGSGEAELFSDLNGTGTEVGIIPLTPQTGFFPAGDSEPFFRSVVFQLSTDSVTIDDVTFGGLVVPEPPLAALLALGIGGLILSRRIHD